MDLITSAYLTAFVLGAAHAIELDHMVAVSVFAGLKPKFKAAASYGARWGAGHAIIVVLVGSVLAWLNVKLDESWQYRGEALVGIALIGLGIWAFIVSIRSVEVEEEPALASANRATTPASPQHNQLSARHQHLPTAMGALHGLAGSVPLLALIPITLLNDFQQAIIYLVLFSVGTTLAMVVYAVLAACAVRGLGVAKLSTRWLSTAIASVTLSVGVFWLLQAWASL